MGQAGHILKKFDEELSTLRDLVLRMGGLAEEQLRRALAALDAQTDSEGVRAIVAGDREIDRIELRADEEVAHLLALRSPLGIDLRTVLTFAKTVTDLERIGDEAKKIAKTARAMGEAGADTAQPFLAPLRGVGTAAQESLRGALDALVRLDLARAEAVKQGDATVDAAFKAAITHITATMQAEPTRVAAGVQAIFAAKAMERIGDHAKNIAQYVFYLVQGRDVRHPRARQP